MDQPAAAFVGSSNLSGSGLNGGIEWNLLVGTIDELRERFLVLWLDHRSLPLTDELIASYQPAPTYVPEAVEVVETPEERPKPRPIQEEALRALHKLATTDSVPAWSRWQPGLGKTWLAAFDAAQARSRPGAVHRPPRGDPEAESRRLPSASIRSDHGPVHRRGENNPTPTSSSRRCRRCRGTLDRFASDDFDYIVVDEFHHAAAATYRRVLDHFTPRFLLGLTATPERMDGADLLSLCADNLAFRVRSRRRHSSRRAGAVPLLGRTRSG